MKYKDLPKEETIHKLVSIAFDAPARNWQVYEWAESILKCIRFAENERIKLVLKYGDKDADGSVKVPTDKIQQFLCDYNKVLESDVDTSAKPIGITKEWFENCEYPKDKALWITPAEIAMIVAISK